jgi:hypothetical protein
MNRRDLLKAGVSTIRWMLPDSLPLSIEGPGLLEMLAWETEPGYTLHNLNYANPNTHRG